MSEKTYDIAEGTRSEQAISLTLLLLGRIPLPDVFLYLSTRNTSRLPGAQQDLKVTRLFKITSLTAADGRVSAWERQDRRGL